MQKRTFMIFCMSFVVLCSYAQQKQIHAPIPIKAGPWKFGGLPGLILKAYETKYLYAFEAVGIEKGKYPVMQYEYKGYKKSIRTTVQKYQRTFTENWTKSVG